jgi:hypothetical protein
VESGHSGPSWRLEPLLCLNFLQACVVPEERHPTRAVQCLSNVTQRGLCSA